MSALSRVIRGQNFVAGLVMFTQALANINALQFGRGTAVFIDSHLGGLAFFDAVLTIIGLAMMIRAIRGKVVLKWELVIATIPIFAYIAAAFWYTSSSGLAKSAWPLYAGYYLDQLILILNLEYGDVKDGRK